MSRLPVAAARLVGAVFLVSGMMKIFDGAHFATSVASYALSDETLTGTVALVLPGMEVAAGVCLMTRRHCAAGALAALALSLVFFSVLAWRIAQGDTADCGCLGENLKSSVPVSLARAGALGVLASYVFVHETYRAHAAPRGDGTFVSNDASV